MEKLTQMDPQRLKQAHLQFLQEYEDVRALGLNLNIARGKPNAAQLDLSAELLHCIEPEDLVCGGVDYRNYGILDGIPEAKALFSRFLGATPEETIIYGNASLNIMYDVIVRALLFGVGEGKRPWGQQGKIKFLCPSPGYDRHFAICEQLGIEMIPIRMTDEGPDMDTVERLVGEDPAIKGIWCVPKYSNPQGIVYSDRTVRRFASLRCAADDFRIFWDNAYCIHDLYEPVSLLNLLEECKKTGNENLPYIFFSTSKITFPGAGVAAMACSRENCAWQKKRMSAQTIGYDKINQMRHVKFFGDETGVLLQMQRHAEILRPKFEVVLDAFDRELQPLGCVHYLRPRGGYFISLDVLEGCARRTVELCKEAGVILTDAGATFPYHHDPEDRNIRIAPSYLDVSEMEIACRALCAAVKLACSEKLLKK